MEQLVGKNMSNRSVPALPSRYQIKSLLGQRAGRRTFLAADLETGQPVVIKLVLFGLDATWEEIKLFKREAETLKSLDHPALPQYIDYFEVKISVGKGFALVQTYIKAPSLADIVTSGRRFSERQLQPMARALLSILDYLHNCYPAVIHRDIKPSNILLSEGTHNTPAKLYLIDFGAVQAAKPDGTLTVVGTYGYMPPEQFGGRAQPASDLYSLGATLIYLATGQHPAELTQDNMQIAFETHPQVSNAFTTGFTQWLRQLTYADLSARFQRADDALSQLSMLKRGKGYSTQRSALQPHPRQGHQITRADFHLHPTPNELKIQCLQFRIREPFRIQRSALSLLCPDQNTRFFVEFGWYTGLALLLAFGGWGIAAIAGPLVFALVFPYLWSTSQHSQAEQVSLTLHREFEQVCSISLETSITANPVVPRKNQYNNNPSRTNTSDYTEIEKTSHFTNILLKAYRTKLRHSLFNSEISFMSEADSDVETRSSVLSRLQRILFKQQKPTVRCCRIVGTRQEMQWVSGQLQHWQNAEQQGGV